ncbi:MAG: hypothetical protein CUN55_12865, partial [Phototrophicales bacterium]
LKGLHKPIMGALNHQPFFTLTSKRAEAFGWLTGFLTVALLIAVPPQFLPNDTLLWLWIIGLTALTINFGLSFTQGELSAAPSVSLLAYLLLDDQQLWGNVLWAVAIGTVLGILMRESPRYLLKSWRLISFKLAGAMLRTIGQLILSLAIGRWFYHQLDGQIPLKELRFETIMPILGFIGVELAVYLALTIVYIRSRYKTRPLPQELLLNWDSLIGVLILPMPLAIISAISYHTISTIGFLISSFAMLITIMSIYGLSRSQYRYEQQVRDLSTLANISNAIRGSLNLDTLLEALYLQVSSLLKVDNFTIALYDPLRLSIVFPIHRRNGQPMKISPVPYIDDTIGDKTARHVGNFIIENAVKYRIIPPDLPQRAWIGVPILTSQQRMGAMFVIGDPRREFTHQETQLLATIAAQSGFAIDNGQLYAQARHRVQQLRILTNVSTQLNSTLDPDMVLKLAVRFGVEVMQADGAAIYVWQNGRRDRLQLVASHQMSDNFVHEAPLPLLTEHEDIFNQQAPLVVADIENDVRAERLQAILLKENKLSFIEVLLRHADELLGIFVIYYRSAHIHLDEDIEVLLTFANQVALALSNARSYRAKEAALARRVEQLMLLETLGQELFSARIQLREIYDLVLQRAANGTKAQIAVLALRIADSNLPYPAATYGDIPAEVSPKALIMGATMHVLRTGETVLISDTQQDQRYPTISSSTRSILSVPILQGMKVTGAITLESDTPQAFGNEDMIFLIQVGAQIRIASDNLTLIESIESNRDRLQTILDSMTEGIILLNKQGNVRLVNPRIQSLLGIEPQTLHNHALVRYLDQNPSSDISQRLGFTNSDELRSKLAELRENKWLPEGESGGIFMISTDNSNRPRFINRRDVAVYAQDGRIIGWLMVFEDVTEERELQQNRQDLSNMIVHDLRGPLTAIKASLALINAVAEGKSKPVIEQTIDTASRAVNKMLNLINSLLDISKMENGTMSLECEPKQMYGIAQSVIDSLKALADEMEVHLINQVPEDLPLLDIDADKIERVLFNLIDNAIKFTPSEGQVSVRVVPQPIVGKDGRSFLTVQVVDTGPGIPDEYKEKLFERYVQIEGRTGRRKGTGLGLTFCALAVEAHA